MALQTPVYKGLEAIECLLTQRWQLLIIASSVQLRCRDGLHGNTLVKFLLKYLTVVGIFSACDQIKSDWQYANIFDK